MEDRIGDYSRRIKEFQAKEWMAQLATLKSSS